MLLCALMAPVFIVIRECASSLKFGAIVRVQHETESFPSGKRQSDVRQRLVMAGN